MQLPWPFVIEMATERRRFMACRRFIIIRIQFNWRNVRCSSSPAVAKRTKKKRRRMLFRGTILEFIDNLQEVQKTRRPEELFGR